LETTGSAQRRTLQDLSPSPFPRGRGRETPAAREKLGARGPDGSDRPLAGDRFSEMIVGLPEIAMRN
jgi:hypothetical protein